jgi:iron(III) transport system substrate-binding protein
MRGSRTGGGLLAAAGLLVGALAMSACGGSSTPRADTSSSAGASGAPSTAQLYQAAKAEGSLTIYGPFQSTYKPLYDKFTATYPGVTVKTVDLFGPPLTARLQAEIATNKLGADLLATGPVDLGQYAQKGWLAAFRPAGAASLPATYVGSGDTYTEPVLTEATMFYNTKSLTAQQVPKTWADLLAPAWKGKLALPDPAIPGLSSQSLAAAEKAGVIDDAGLKSLAANATKYATVPAALQAVATGQKQIGLLTAYQLIQNAATQGAPIKFLTLSDGTPATGSGYAVLAKAAHPNAAKLLATWMLTPEAQQGIAALALQGTMPGAPSPAGGLAGLSDLKILSMDLSPTDLAAAQKKLTATFGGGQ